MLIERQVSIFFAGISAALAIPEYTKHAPVADGPHVGLLIGTALGTLGLLMGIVIAAEEFNNARGRGERLWYLGKILVWTLFAFGLSAGTAITALHAPGIGWRIVLGVNSLAPLAGLMFAFVQYRKF